MPYGDRMHTTNTVAAVAFIVATAVAAPAAADPVESGLRIDVEVDPTAYALSGNSLHVGLGYRHWRVDLGNFAMALPEWVHGTEGVDVAFDGYGAKLQLFPFAEQTGFFAGVDAAWTRQNARSSETGASERWSQLGVGVNLGYRITVVDRVYVTPWIGVGYQLGARDAVIEGQSYAPSPVTVFPAVHVGYQLR